MSYSIQFILLGMIILMLSAVLGCGGEEQRRDGAKVLYQAIDKLDTASMNIHLNEHEFYGQYEINYGGMMKDSGDVNGVLHGDTLKGTFHYQHYGIQQWYRIPISLLKKDGKLVMGKADMEIYMNMTFFKKGDTIDYSNPKFVFQPVK